jgi:hypothetical protein
VTISNLMLSNIVQSRRYNVMTRQDIDRLVAVQLCSCAILSA